MFSLPARTCGMRLNAPKLVSMYSPRLGVSNSITFSPSRLLSTPPMEPYEQKIYDMLQSAFSPSTLAVRDVSGGCGSMFAISVESASFKGIPMIKQHRLVNEVLKDEISKWHGLQLKTKAA